MSSSYTVVFDACVLYPAPLRDLLLELSSSGLFRARWSDEIHDEWVRNLLKNRPDLTLAALQRTRELMNAAVLDCLVANYHPLIRAIDLPDPDDRHVLAAAIHCNADAIITFNLKDFPVDVLAAYDIEAQHPDEFLHHQFGLDDASMIRAAARCRARLQNPVKSGDEYLRCLEEQQLPQLAGALRRFVDVI